MRVKRHQERLQRRLERVAYRKQKAERLAQEEKERNEVAEARRAAEMARLESDGVEHLQDKNDSRSQFEIAAEQAKKTWRKMVIVKSGGVAAHMNSDKQEALADFLAGKSLDDVLQKSEEGIGSTTDSIRGHSRGGDGSSRPSTSFSSRPSTRQGQGQGGAHFREFQHHTHHNRRCGKWH